MLAQVLLFDSPSGFQSAAIFKSLINFKKNYHLKFCLMCKSHHFLSTIRVLQKQKHYNQNNKNRKYTKINHWFNLIFCTCHFWMIAKNEFFFFDAAYEFEVQLLPLLSEQRSLTLNGSRYVNTAGLIAWVAMKHCTEELDSGVT